MTRDHPTPGISFVRRPGARSRLELTAPPESRPDGVDRPSALDALQFMFAALGELQPAARHEVGHGPRYENLARTRQGRNSLADVHGDAADVLATQFDL